MSWPALPSMVATLSSRPRILDRCSTTLSTASTALPHHRRHGIHEPDACTPAGLHTPQFDRPRGGRVTVSSPACVTTPQPRTGVGHTLTTGAQLPGLVAANA